MDFECSLWFWKTNVVEQSQCTTTFVFQKQVVSAFRKSTQSPFTFPSYLTFQFQSLANGLLVHDNILVVKQAG